MSEAKNKTQKTTQSAAAFLRGVKPLEKQMDCFKILEIMKKVTGLSPKMWGPSIIGFGEYHYKYDSGREGDMCRIGFSPRAQYLAIYLMPGYQDFNSELVRLGKHKMGKSCLNIKRLADVDQTVFEEMISKSLRLLEEKYPS